MSIGEKLKELRESRGLNKREIAEKLEMPYTTYNNYETDARDVGSETLRKIARFYGVTIDYILENEQPDDLTEYLDELRYRPEMRMLFSISKKATKEQVEGFAKAFEIIVKGKDNEDEHDR